jgi:hypothetical protein
VKARDLAVLAVLGGLAYFLFAKKPETVEANIQADVQNKQTQQLDDLARQVQDAINKGDYATAYDLLLKQEQLKAQVITPVVVPQQEQVTIQKVELTPEEKQEIINYVQSLDLSAEEKQTLTEEMLKQAEMLKNYSLGVNLYIDSMNLNVDSLKPVVDPKLYHEDYGKFMSYTVNFSFSLDGEGGTFSVPPSRLDGRILGGRAIDLSKIKNKMPGKLIFNISCDSWTPIYYSLVYHAQVYPKEYVPGVCWQEKNGILCEGYVDRFNPKTHVIDVPYPAHP